MSIDQAKAICDKLLTSLDATYNTAGTKFDSLRKELYNVIGPLAYKAVSESSILGRGSIGMGSYM